MNSTKAVIDYTGYTVDEMGSIAQAIHDQMSTNAADFGTPPVLMPALQTLITTFVAALADRKATNSSADILELAEAREALDDALSKLGQHVNTVANGNALLVDKSGCPSYTTGSVPDPSAPEAPENLRLKHGTVSGSIVARYKPRRINAANEVQINEGDPNVAADWKPKGTFLRGRADLAGLTPGTVVWVRVRTIGLKGILGAWSDPAQIRVL